MYENGFRSTSIVFHNPIVLVLFYFMSSYSFVLLQVLVPKKSEFKGKMIEVDIYEAGKHYMKGRPVEDAKVFTPSIAQPLQKGQVSGLPQVSLHYFVI